MGRDVLLLAPGALAPARTTQVPTIPPKVAPLPPKTAMVIHAEIMPLPPKGLAAIPPKIGTHPVDKRLEDLAIKRMAENAAKPAVVPAVSAPAKPLAVVGKQPPVMDNRLGLQALANQRMTAAVAATAGKVTASAASVKQQAQNTINAMAAKTVQREGNTEVTRQQTAAEMDRLIQKDKMLKNPTKQDDSSQDRRKQGPDVGEKRTGLN